MNKFTIAYFGSSDFSADFLEKLLNDPTSSRSAGLRGANQLVEVKFVVTQPDRLAGRKQVLTPTPVKTVALKHRLEVLEIKNLDLFKNLDLCLLYAYGKIIPQELLNLPKFGFWCLHPSLLPKYRGTSPMATALINGDRETGVTIIKMDDQIDHGPIIAQEKYQISLTDRRPDLEKKLTDLGFEMFKKIINVIARSETTKQSQNEIANDIFKLIPQSHSDATYTKKLKKDDGFIPFENLKLKIENSPEILYNLFRGLFPWPGLWTLLRPFGTSEGQALKRLKITDMDYKDGKIIIKKVQLEGKKEVDFETFKKAY